MALLLNTTFFAEDAVANELLRWLREVYLADLKASGLFHSPLLCEVTPRREPGVTAYALQAVCPVDADVDRWTDNRGAELLCELTASMGSKALHFTTLMKVHEQ